MASSSGGISGRMLDGGGATWWAIWYTRFTLVLASKGRRPVSSWYITTPRE
jgi:hypothetical protein